MIDALLTSPLSLAIGVGILVTAALGRLCGPFLDTSVTVDFPYEFEDFKDAETGGGGAQLGIIERLLFFASVWLEGGYVIAGGWLTFKALAKWAAWQHVAKIPETLNGKNAKEYAYARFQLSCRLLGRFLNGTLYNIFCAGVGWLVSSVLLRYSYSYFTDANLLYWNIVVFILIAALIGRPLIGSPSRKAFRCFIRRKKD